MPHQQVSLDLPEGLQRHTHHDEQAGAARLRELFEALGPSFVKIGQLLALHAAAPQGTTAVDV
mgnify:CR=1 FL=1